MLFLAISYDFCVPPPLPADKLLTGQDSLTIEWLPSSSAKIQVAGIDSILFAFEDDKLQVDSFLGVYVQVSLLFFSLFSPPLSFSSKI